MMMMVSSLISIIVLSVIIWNFEENIETKLYIFLLSISLFFQTVLVIDYNFQGRVKSKYSTLSKSSALLVSSFIKIYLVLVEAELTHLVIAFMLDHLITATFLVAMHIYKKQPNFIFKFDIALARSLLKSAWPMTLSALAIMLYMRVDQIMIKNMLDVHQLGLYAAATRIYEGWIIIPYVISMSLIPAIVHLKSQSIDIYESRLTQLFSFLIWLGIFSALSTYFFGDWLINIAFGHEYIASASVLNIIMWSSVLTAIGSVTSRYLTVENMEKKIATRSVLGLLINILLNMILIPVYGINGAAIATLVTLLIVNYFINYLDDELNQLLRICNNAFFLKRVFTNKPGEE